MLEEMDSVHLAEWWAFEEIVAEEQKRAELAAKAEAAVKNHKRGRR